MNESLKEQLMALGLAPKKNLSKPPKQKPSKKVQPKVDGADISLDQAYRIRGKEERRQKEQAIAKKRELEKQRRMINQKISGLIKEFSIKDNSAEIKRSFIYKGRIRSVLVTDAQLKSLNDGEMAVVYLSGNYHLLPSDHISEILKFAPDHVPDLSGSEQEGEEDNPVPDDLVW